MLLRTLDVDHFLAHHWQRRPLLIRGALPDFTPPVSADELAGLALESEVESRIVEQHGGQWQLRNGPFDVDDLQRQGAWSLLVQAVDHYIPEVAALRDLVGFLPRWRGDDIMVSYATDSGSVGPHFDHYDVFLLQGEGQRLWRLGQHCDDSSPCLPDTDLRILANFETREEHLLQTGDILYVPPGVAHWGIARGECTTFSIGFRAPRRQEMLARWVDQALEQDSADALLGDGGRRPALRPGELAAHDLDNARQQAMALLRNATDPAWLGELVTEPRYPVHRDPPDSETLDALDAGDCELQMAPESRLAWSKSGDRLWVFANGDSAALPVELRDPVIALLETGSLPAADTMSGITPPQWRALALFLIESGCCHVG